MGESTILEVSLASILLEIAYLCTLVAICVSIRINIIGNLDNIRVREMKFGSFKAGQNTGVGSVETFKYYLI